MIIIVLGIIFQLLFFILAGIVVCINPDDNTPTDIG